MDIATVNVHPFETQGQKVEQESSFEKNNLLIVIDFYFFAVFIFGLIMKKK